MVNRRSPTNIPQPASSSTARRSSGARMNSSAGVRLNGRPQGCGHHWAVPVSGAPYIHRAPLLGWEAAVLAWGAAALAWGAAIPAWGAAQRPVAVGELPENHKCQRCQYRPPPSGRKLKCADWKRFLVMHIPRRTALAQRSSSPTRTARRHSTPHLRSQVPPLWVLTQSSHCARLRGCGPRASEYDFAAR